MIITVRVIDAVLDRTGAWWDKNGDAAITSVEKHKAAYVGILGFGLLALGFIFGGSVIKSGIVFGLILTFGIVMLLMHGDTKKTMERARKIAAYAIWVDVTIALMIFFVFIGISVTTGIAMAVVGITTTFILHLVRAAEKRKKETGRLAPPADAVAVPA